MRALLIDTAAKEIRPVEYGGGGDLNTLIGGWIRAAWHWSNGDVLYVDDDGLRKSGPLAYFRLLLRRDAQPLAGNGVVVGREVEDKSPAGYHTKTPTISREQLSKVVRFLTDE